MRLLITGAWSGAERYIPELEAMGHSVVFLQQERDALPCDPAWVEGVVCNGLFLYHPLERFSNLRLIQLTSAGFDRVPMESVRARRIEIHNAHGVYSVPMAEFALSGVLQLFKQSRFFYENQKACRWEKRRDLRELCGKTIVIVGCGQLGTECARRFRAFGCRVVGLNRTPRENECFDTVLPLTELERVLPTADVLVLSLGLDASTRGLMNSERFALMKAGAVLVNLARGGLVEQAALLASLDRLGGAVLDVFEEEPLPPESPLWRADNVILTPHNSFVGEGNGERLARMILAYMKN